MNRLLLPTVFAAFSFTAALGEEPKKPDAPKPAPAKPAPPKPAAKPATPKPAPKPPAPSKGDIALAAARKCDADKSGKLAGSEVGALREAFKDPKNFLDLYDDDANGALDEKEVARINALITPPKPKSTDKSSKSKPKK